MKSNLKFLINRPGSTFYETLLKTACPSTRQGVSLGLAIALLGLPITNLRAQSSLDGFTVTIQQEGTNVVATGSGMLNLSALGLFETGYSGYSQVHPVDGVIIVGTNTTDVDLWDGTITGSRIFGTGITTILANSGSGSTIGCVANVGPVNLIVPEGYVSGTALSDSATWSDETISGLGLTPGTYTLDWGSGSTASFFTLDVVPEPDSMILLGVGGLALAAYRRKISAK